MGNIFMPFSNPTCHIRDTADFTRLKTVGGVFLPHKIVHTYVLTTQNRIDRILVVADKKSKIIVNVVTSF